MKEMEQAEREAAAQRHAASLEVERRIARARRMTDYLRIAALRERLKRQEEMLHDTSTLVRGPALPCLA